MSAESVLSQAHSFQENNLHAFLKNFTCFLHFPLLNSLLNSLLPPYLYNLLIGPGVFDKFIHRFEHPLQHLLLVWFRKAFAENPTALLPESMRNWGNTLALVGESGSGKMMLARLYEPTAVR